MGHRGEQALPQLLAAHFHREDDQRRQAGVDEHVLDDVERERGLPHARAPGDDDQVPRLHAGGLLVDRV
jgi:hypothetical protein